MVQLSTIYYQTIYNCFFSNNYRNQMCTSIQDIVVTCEQEQQLRQERDLLFKQRQYPLFELEEFHRDDRLSSNQNFIFFLEILEEWNRKVGLKALPTYADSLFTKVQFIYSSLKSICVKNTPLATYNLKVLFKWFDSLKQNTLQPNYKTVTEKQRYNEEWNLRAAFNTNTQDGIHEYRRRIVWNFDKDDNQSPTQRQKSTPFANRTNLGKPKTDQQQQNTNSKYPKRKQNYIKIQNEIVRDERESKELNKIQKVWYNEKTKYQQKLPKNFYRGNFTSQKIFKATNTKNENFFKFDHIISRRIKTTEARRFKTQPAQLEGKKQKSEEVGQTRALSVKNKSQSLQYKQFAADAFFDYVPKLTDINGLKLMSNPFVSKLKKKKKKK